MVRHTILTFLQRHVLFVLYQFTNLLVLVLSASVIVTGQDPFDRHSVHPRHVSVKFVVLPEGRYLPVVLAGLILPLQHLFVL